MGKLLDIALGAAAIGGGVWAVSKIKHGGTSKPTALSTQSARTSVPRTISFGPIRFAHPVALIGGGSPEPAPADFSGDGVSPPPTNLGGDLSGGGSLDANQILGDANAAVGLVGTVGNLVNSFGGSDPSSDSSGGFDASGGIDYTGQGDPGPGY